jgi:NADH:ubiquinone oxidoreductase subunit 6 (subunit J)
MQGISSVWTFLYETAVFLVEDWRITLPALLGLISIFLLLPRARPYPRLWGSLAGAIALVLGGWLLIWGKVATPEAVLFYAFSLLAVLSGTLLVTQRNPVHAALSFALVVLSTCGLFLLQAAPFLMAATIIVYAGAIVVTFLFVIMLAQQAGMSDADHRSREPALSTIAGFVLLGGLVYLLQVSYDVTAANELLAKTEGVIARVGGLLETAAPDAATSKDATAVLEETNFNDLITGFEKEAKDHSALPDSTRLLAAARETQMTWNDVLVELQSRPARSVEGQAKLEELKQSLLKLKQVGTEVRDTYGNLQPHGDKPERFSEFSGPRPNEPLHKLPRDAQGEVQMPAQNVAALGRSLFSDYLVPVELGGTLLLVATIGAIAISGRGKEGLR